MQTQAPPRRDTLGYRKTFGVVAPSTNTSVQPEYDDFRPRGVTNHFARIDIPNNPVHSDADFDQLMKNIRGSLEAAIGRVVTCEPDAIILGMSSETFWDGLDGSKILQDRMEKISQRPVVMGSDACQAALKAYGGNIKRLGIITPYYPIGDNMVRKFFTDCGFEVVHLHGFKCDGPVNIARVTEEEMRDAFNLVNDDSVDALVQVGTNLACARVAAHGEFWLNKPVIAINTATYWYALRQNGITDQMVGYGALLAEH
jgi:maleate isomerase